MSASEENLPAGWTVARIREESGAADARLLDPTRHLVVLDSPGENDYIELDAAVIVTLTHGICLLQEADHEDWYMGQLGEDGSIICWASYGTELGEAIRAI